LNQSQSLLSKPADTGQTPTQKNYAITRGEQLPMLWSETYAAKASAQNCIESLKKNAPAAPVIDLTKEETGKGYRFEIAGSKDKQFFVRFVAANGEPMVRSETYTRRASALKCINSLKTRAAAAETVEEL